MPKTSKNLVLVLATSVPITEASKEDKVILERIPCIYYLLHFRKNTVEVKTLFDSSSKVNAITPVYASKLDLQVRCTNVRIWKIDGSILKIFRMILVSFQIENKLEKAWFF